MGSFSWLKADELTQTANIVHGAPFKFLIPKEFGGGYIKDHYRDYGKLLDKYDMYEIVACWNYPDEVKSSQRNRDSLNLKEIDEYTDENRILGINISIDDNNADNLKYPLKLVSISFKGEYEDIKKPSYSDPNQGFGPLKR